MDATTEKGIHVSLSEMLLSLLLANHGASIDRVDTTSTSIVIVSHTVQLLKEWIQLVVLLSITSHCASIDIMDGTSRVAYRY